MEAVASIVSTTSIECIGQASQNDWISAPKFILQTRSYEIVCERSPMQDQKPTELARQSLPRVSYEAPRRSAGGEVFEMWHELCRPAFDTTSLEAADQLQLDFDWYNLDGLIFNRTAYSAMQFDRTARHVEHGGADLVVLHFLLSGREEVEIAGRPVVMAPDRIVLVDWSHPFTRRTTAVEQLSIGIPRHLLSAGERLYDVGPVLEWELDTATGKMLAGAMTNIWESLPNWCQDDATPVSSGFLRLLGGLIEAKLGDAPDPNIMPPATLAVMKSHLTSRLGNPSLGADDLVQAFLCSRSTVYRLFHECGGVKAFIREQRLAKCLRTLTKLGRSKRPLGEVARAWGFADVAYFHRLFKRRFDITPGEAVRLNASNQEAIQQAGHTSVSPEACTIHQWLGIVSK